MTDVPTTEPARAREVLVPTRQVLEAEIGRLAAIVGASGYDVVGFDTHVDAGCPYIEIGAAGQLPWIVKERGVVLDHRTTSDPDELLYWSFQATTFSLACDWELLHRDESQDFRIGLWAKQADLLYRLNPTWAQRWLRELAARQPGDVGMFPDLPPDRRGETT